MWRVFTTFSVQMCRKAFILRLCRVFDHEARTGNLMFLTPAKHLTFMTLGCAKSFVRTAFRRTKKPMASNYDKNVLPPDSRNDQTQADAQEYYIQKARRPGVDASQKCGDRPRIFHKPEGTGPNCPCSDHLCFEVWSAAAEAAEVAVVAVVAVLAVLAVVAVVAVAAEAAFAAVVASSSSSAAAAAAASSSAAAGSSPRCEEISPPPHSPPPPFSILARVWRLRASAKTAHAL